MDYTIRLVTLADGPGIAHVARYTWRVTYAQSISAQNRKQVLDQAYTHQALRQVIERAHDWFYVAAQSETVVGFAQFLRRFDAQGELVRLYVHPDHQRRGIGRTFLATGLAAMAAKGVDRCHVSVEASNIGARVFYERFGFRVHREYGRFLGDQIVQLVEYAAPIASLLETIELSEN